MQKPASDNAAVALFELDRFESAAMPTPIELAYAGQLAAAVWLLRLTDEAARQALAAYARARYTNRLEQACLRASLLAEYRLCRERLDLCS